ncbi:MAG: hypothetical protein K0U66_10125 [Gammaproteobacteria bacterium]|nr:hypothetical protein [Gammaproteobacteria bacterium]
MSELKKQLVNDLQVYTRELLETTVSSIIEGEGFKSMQAALQDEGHHQLIIKNLVNGYENLAKLAEFDFERYWPEDLVKTRTALIRLRETLSAVQGFTIGEDKRANTRDAIRIHDQLSDRVVGVRFFVVHENTRRD